MKDLDRGQFVGDTTDVEANYFTVGAVHSF